VRNTLGKLFTVQEKLLRDPRPIAARVAKLAHLRAEVPERLLAHFLRLLVQGRRGVVLVRHGTCMQCHIRLPAGTVALLVRSDEAHTCEHCGGFLLLPEDEMPVRRVRPRAAEPVAAEA
jgi:predicted  nucleic acid-binding Zn-ribbon protein